MANAYVTRNAAAALAVTDFTGTNLPADATRAYLMDGRMDKQVVFAAGAASTIVIDFGVATSLMGIAILNHNCASLTQNVTVLIEADTSAGFGTAVFAKANTPLNATAPRQRDTVLQFAALSRRYWRLTFTFGGGGQVLKIGEILPYASATQLTRGYVDGAGEPEEIISVGAQMMYGESRAAYMAGPMRHKRLRFQDYTTAQNAELLAMWRAVNGPVSPILWIESYEAVSTTAANAQQDCLYGRFEQQLFDWNWTDFDIVQPPELTIRQLGRSAGQ